MTPLTFRTRHSLTQAQAGELIGYTSRMWRGWEASGKAPKAIKMLLWYIDKDGIENAPIVLEQYSILNPSTVVNPE